MTTPDPRDGNRDGRVSASEAAMSALYRHAPHPHIAARREQGPVKVADQHPDGNAVARFNARIANLITAVVGTMWAFYVFNGIALVSLPTAIKTGDPQVIVNWMSSNWIQLILLPALMVGQSLQGRAADARAEQTFHDASATLHEAEQIQQHLAEQDKLLADLIERQRQGKAAATERLDPSQGT